MFVLICSAIAFIVYIANAPSTYTCYLYKATQVVIPGYGKVYDFDCVLLGEI